MRYIEVKRGRRIAKQRAVAGQQRSEISGVSERPEPVKGAEVVGEVAVVRDDRGSAAKHGVAGQHRGVGPNVQADRVGRVARGRDDLDLAASDADHGPRRQTLGAEPVRLVNGPDTRSGELGQAARARRVVGVAVGQHDRRDRKS